VQQILNRIVAGKIDLGARITYAAARAAVINKFRASRQEQIYLDRLGEPAEEPPFDAALVDAAARTLHHTLSARIPHGEYAGGSNTDSLAIREGTDAEILKLAHGPAQASHFLEGLDTPWEEKVMTGSGEEYEMRFTRVEARALCTLTRAEGMALCTLIRFAKPCNVHWDVRYYTADGRQLFNLNSIP
jgi:hypothetical protein